MLIKERFCLCIEVFLDCLEDLAKFGRDLIDGNNDLLSCITAYNYDLSVLDIFRTDFDTCRDTEHLLLTELPSRALLGIIDLRAVPRCLQRCKKLVRFVKHTFFVLCDRNDSRLHRCDPRRKHQTTVVAVYHDDRADDSGG